MTHIATHNLSMTSVSAFTTFYYDYNIYITELWRHHLEFTRKAWRQHPLLSIVFSLVRRSCSNVHVFDVLGPWKTWSTLISFYLGSAIHVFFMIFSLSDVTSSFVVTHTENKILIFILIKIHFISFHHRVKLLVLVIREVSSLQVTKGYRIAQVLVSGDWLGS